MDCKLPITFKCTNTNKAPSRRHTLDEIFAVSARRQIYSLLSVKYCLCSNILFVESHRDQLKLALSIPVLCVLITRVRKTDGLTEKVIR